MLLDQRRQPVDARVQPVLAEPGVLMLAPQLAPGGTVRHARPASSGSHLRVQVPCFLGVEPVALHPARGDQKMRVPVRPLALGFRSVRRVHVELNRQALRDEMRLGEGAGHGDAVLGRDLGVGRQRQHDLAGDLGVLAALGRLRRVPQLARLGEPGRGAVRQQHGMVLGRVAVAEVERTRPCARR